MSQERMLREYGGTYAEFMRNESEPESELERVTRVSEGERTCCTDPDCPVWSDDWLSEEATDEPD